MSKIETRVEDGFLYITNVRARKNPMDQETVEISELANHKVYSSYVKTTKDDYVNRLLMFTELDEEKTEPEEGMEEAPSRYVIIFSSGKKIKYAVGKPEELLKKLVQLKVKVLGVSLNKRKLSITLLGYYVNKYKDLELSGQCLRVSDTITAPFEFPVKAKAMGKAKVITSGLLRKVSVPVKSIVEDVETISSNISAEITINGFQVRYGLPKRKRKLKVSKTYYAPIAKAVVGDLMLFIRRNARGNITLVTRPLDEYERTGSYRFWESTFVSAIMYGAAKVARKLSKKQVNLYFEKETMKAEEGAFDVFERTLKDTTSENYYIIDKRSEDYDRIKSTKNVIVKYTPKYYWLAYRANNVITTEAPAHLNILRSANKYIRLRMIQYKFVFLQHGVTYMKCHGPMSAFVAGREAEPSYIFVGSKKERDIVVDMMHLPEERVLVTGLPIFANIDFKHINQSSEDYVTIMLTFKPYEERLDDFENSRYYHAILDLFAIAKKYVPEDKILIVAHPRIEYLLATTSLKDRMWQKSVSDVLGITKLMITDYSSVGYNSFYQGAGVVFYQEDIEEYQEICGELIPNADEYIGKRAFNLEEFDQIMSDVTEDGHVILDRCRTEEHEKNYHSINSFNDGKNIDRIYDELKRLQLV
ncbi:MAG: CDP-glycerol glycerophosphotransferase family protein [bacterium]|nr:CDP-glycerol glycerophosphotransferase family protein [bacterium]